MAIGLITTPASWANRTVVTPTWLQNVQDTVNYLLATMHCGDGSDADPVISSGTTTLTRDMYYANLSLSGGTLATAGWCIYVKGTFTWSGGALQCNGAAGGVGNSGNGVGGLTSLVSGGPHLGGSGIAGTQTATTPQPGSTIIGFGGAGGAGGASGGAGGSPGSFYASTSDRKYKIPPFRQSYGGPDAYGQSLPLTVLGKYGTAYCGGTGGGGGRGDGTRQGGCGGEGGGLLFVIANSIVITGSPTASATGGAGGAGQASGNCGGGGGGGGGAGILIYGSISGSPPSITVTGGAGGAATGTGNAGTSGSSGSSAFKTYALGT